MTRNDWAILWRIPSIYLLLPLSRLSSPLIQPPLLLINCVCFNWWWLTLICVCLEGKGKAKMKSERATNSWDKLKLVTPPGVKIVISERGSMMDWFGAELWKVPGKRRVKVWIWLDRRDTDPGTNREQHRPIWPIPSSGSGHSIMSCDEWPREGGIRWNSVSLFRQWFCYFFAQFFSFFSLYNRNDLLSNHVCSNLSKVHSHVGYSLSLTCHYVFIDRNHNSHVLIVSC